MSAAHRAALPAALALLAGTQFVLVLDASIINVALPSIGRDLHVTATDLSWVVNAYILLFGGFLLLGGRLADRFGPRRLYMAGLTLFGAASLAGGLATSPLWLVAARAGQGLGAALVSPAALAIVMRLFSEGQQRNRALGIWAALGGSGGAAGAILGGVLIDTLGWQAVLFVNVPIAALAVALAPRLLPAAASTATRDRFDVAGAVTITAGLSLLVYAVLEANDAGWASAQTMGLTAAALALVALFMTLETRRANALMPLRTFRNRTLLAGNLVTVLNTAALFPMFFFVTLYTQQVLGFSALESGLAQLPLAATIALSATLAPRAIARTGYKPALTVGLVLLAAGLAWLSGIDAGGSFMTHLLAPSLIIGAGEGLVWVSSMIGATSGTAAEDAGLASGLVNTAQQFGGALGIAALVAIATAVTDGASPATPAGAAITDGLSAGLLAGAAIAAIAAVLAVLLFPAAAGGPRRRRRRAIPAAEMA